MDYSIVHYQEDPKNYNVKCRNGSYHVKRTTNIKLVTCELCKEPSKLKKFFEKMFK